MLMSLKKNIPIRWSFEDIASAIALRLLSPKAYRFLRNIMKIPLPSLSTVQKWCAKFTMQPSILKNVFNIMKDKRYNLHGMDKFTVLSFDEIYICNQIDLERKE